MSGGGHHLGLNNQLMKSNYMENQFKSTVEPVANVASEGAGAEQSENVESRNSSLANFTRKKTSLIAQAI